VRIFATGVYALKYAYSAISSLADSEFTLLDPTGDGLDHLRQSSFFVRLANGRTISRPLLGFAEKYQSFV
jgi:hypothetical protein